MGHKKEKSKQDAAPVALKTEQTELLPWNFDSDQFVAFLLQTIHEGGLASLPPYIAEALRLNDFYVDLPSSIVVDSYFSHVAFVAQAGFTARTARVCIQEMQGVVDMVTAGVFMPEVLASFKAQLVQHAMEPTHTPTPEPKVVEEVEEKAPPKGKARGKAPKPVEEAVVEAPKEEVLEPVHYPVPAVSAIAEYMGYGPLQHHRLYQHVATLQDRPETPGGHFQLFCETCAPPLPLHRALPEAVYVERAALRRLEEEAHEGTRIAAEERRLQEAQQAEAFRLAEEERVRQEEAELANNTLRLTNVEAQAAVEALGADLTQMQLQQQARLVERIRLLEDRLGPSLSRPSTVPSTTG